MLFKYAVSYVSEKQARKNYRAEVEKKNFDECAKQSCLKQAGQSSPCKG